jgi:hypothetical protein
MQNILLAALFVGAIFLGLVQARSANEVAGRADLVRKDHQAFFADIEAVMKKHPQSARNFRMLVMTGRPLAEGAAAQAAGAVEVHNVVCALDTGLCWPRDDIL